MNNSKKKIGLLGGSFNPAHLGHLHISKCAIELIGLDEVWWLLTPCNPFKNEKDMMDYDERFDDAKILVNRNDKVLIKDFERQLGYKYSYDVLKHLIDHNQDIQFVWLMGADNLSGFDKWYKWKNIFRLLPIAVFDRGDFHDKAVNGLAAREFSDYRLKEDEFGDKLQELVPSWAYFKIDKHPESSTRIREKTSGL